MKIRLAAASVAALAAPLVLPATHALASTAAPPSNATITPINGGYGYGNQHGYGHGNQHHYGHGNQHHYGHGGEHRYGHGGEHNYGDDDSYGYGGDDATNGYGGAYGFGNQHSEDGGYGYGNGDGDDAGLLGSLGELGVPFPEFT